MNRLKDLFLLDPEVIFLNHGSFGACPRQVFEIYQSWQRQLERQPVEFLGRQAEELLRAARQQLAIFIGAQPDEVVFFPNPTTAINMVARSIKLEPGDEILTTDHEYGAMNRTWRYICTKAGAHYLQTPIPIPVNDPRSIIESITNRITDRTRAVFISHITSPTALIFPVEEICRYCRQAGILSIVDGAHAPGQIQLNLNNLGADIYTGACHKWLMAPKGSAFLYARREIQDLLEPLVVSWGYESDRPSGSRFIDHHEWQGTRDLAAFLAVPAAIDFQSEFNWAAVRNDCHSKAIQARNRIDSLTDYEAVCPESYQSMMNNRWFEQMFTSFLPANTDLVSAKKYLYENYKVEAPLIKWNDHKLIRVSVQGYNDESDIDVLVTALRTLITKL